MVIETREQLEKYLLDIFDNDKNLQDIFATLGNQKQLPTCCQGLLGIATDYYDTDKVLQKSIHSITDIKYEELGKYFNLYMPDLIQSYMDREKPLQCKINNSIVDMTRDEYTTLIRETAENIVKELEKKLDIYVEEKGCYIIKAYNYYVDMFLISSKNTVFDLLGDTKSQLDYLLK